jgi:glycosyltransferase involved in cell wall biosynthesis
MSCLAEYTADEMIDEVLGMHVGLFPLQDVDICRSRGINKATIYMSGEAVVVASDVGQCRDFIQDGVNGFTAGSTSEWVEKLDRLLRDEPLRKRVAARGLETVRSQFSIDHCFATLRGLLEPSGEVAELT